MKGERVLPALLLAACAGCTRRTQITRGPMLVGPEWVTVSNEEIEVRGPQSALCVAMPPGTDYREATGATRTPGGRAVSLSARLVPEAGEPVDLGRPGSSVGRGVRLCFDGGEQLAEGQRFKAVSLRAADTLTVPGITWQSGHRYMLLP